MGLWTGRVAKGKAVVTPSNIRPSVAILRRHQIIGLVAGKPADRYQAVRPFIAIDTIDKSERPLRDLINSATRQLSLAEARIGENLLTLENVWKQAGSPLPSMLEWASIEAARDTDDLDQSVTVIRNYLRLNEALASRIRDLENAKGTLESATGTFTTAELALNTVLANVAVGAQQLSHLLQAANHLFEHTKPPDACPLCGSREFATDLRQTVEAKLKTLTSLQAAISARESAGIELDRAKALSETIEAQAVASAVELCRACSAQLHDDLPSPAAITRICAQPPVAGSSGDPRLEKLRSILVESRRMGELLQSELTRRAQRKLLLQTIRDALINIGTISSRRPNSTRYFLD